jgi:hypothetical protein
MDSLSTARGIVADATVRLLSWRHQERERHGHQLQLGVAHGLCSLQANLYLIRMIMAALVPVASGVLG